MPKDMIAKLSPTQVDKLIDGLSDLEADLAVWDLLEQGIHSASEDPSYKARLYSHIVGWHKFPLENICPVCKGKGYVDNAGKEVKDVL